MRFQTNNLNFAQAFDQFDRGRAQAKERNQLRALTEAAQTLEQGGTPRDASRGLLESGNVNAFMSLTGLANQDSQNAFAREKFEFEKSAGQRPTTAIQNFQFGQQNPAFVTHQQNLKRAGATNVKVSGAKGETAFQKGLGQKSAEMFGKIADDGIAAQDNAILIDKLGELLPKQGGFITGVKGKLAGFGFDVGEGTSDLQAFQSLIDRLTPQQRQGLPGAASDRDVAMFKNSLPNLFNLAGGNDIILNTMIALNAAKMERGRIANEVMTGQLSRVQAIQALKSIGDPLKEFKQFRTANGKQFASARATPQQPVQTPQQPQQITQGQTVINPKTGQRLQFNGQSWGPVQ